jgi:hypothetical protein
VGLTTPHSKKLTVTKVEKMEGSCSTGQSPQWAVVPVEEEEEEEGDEYLAVRKRGIVRPHNQPTTAQETCSKGLDFLFLSSIFMGVLVL